MFVHLPRGNDDLFFVHQLDAEAVRLAAFVSADLADRAVFDARWRNILPDPRIITRTILVARQVAGHISCYPHGEVREVTCWLGRESWGRGVATAALHQMRQLVRDRPISTRAAADNVASIRGLQKCGFKIVGHAKDFAPGRGEETEECLLQLDAGVGDA